MITTKAEAKKLVQPYGKKRIEVHYDFYCPFCGGEVEEVPYLHHWECECSIWRSGAGVDTWERELK